MVFQNYALYPHMSVYQNLAYGLRQRKTPRAEIERRVRETARPARHRRAARPQAGQLSGGQRQRVAMGRALVRRPQAFLLDEPLSNLDAKLRGQVRGELKRLHRQVPVTSIYVTHDQVEAMTLGDRICVMDGGEVQQIGTPDEIYNQPANTFVAAFMGSPPMNLLPARSVRGGVLHVGGSAGRHGARARRAGHRRRPARASAACARPRGTARCLPGSTSTSRWAATCWSTRWSRRPTDAPDQCCGAGAARHRASTSAPRRPEIEPGEEHLFDAVTGSARVTRERISLA